MTAKNWKPQLLVAELNKGLTQLQVAFHDGGADDADNEDDDDHDEDGDEDADDEDANDDIDDDQGHEHSFLPLSPLSHLVYLRGDNFG